MIIQIKCPYCFEWTTITKHEFDNHIMVDCPECYSIFKIKEVPFELVM